MAVSADNVSVTITVADKAIDQAGFGVPLILGPTQAFAERVKTYSASTMLASMVTDGFATTSPEYLAASAILAQSPRPSSIKVGRRAPANVPDLDIDITPQSPVEGEVFTITIDGKAFSVTAGASPTATSVATALVGAISVSGLTATDNTGSLTLTGDTAGSVFDIVCTSNLSVDDQTADASVATELAAVAAAENDWYGLVLASHSTLENIAAAAWCETNKKLFIAVSSDTDILSDTSGNMLETLNSAAYHYTAGMFSRSPGDFPGAAWMGANLWNQPGSGTWKFDTLQGITVDDLTASDISNIRSNKGNYYIQSAGVNMTFEGWAASGRFLDITRFVDWLSARMGERVFSTLVNASGKVPFTDAGINQIVGAVEEVLQTGIRAGGISDNPAPVVTAPRAANVSSSDKAARTLPDVDFACTLGGAIHKTTLTGKVEL